MSDDRAAAVREILSEDIDVDGSEGDSQDGGQDVQAQDDGGTDSGPGVLDESQPDGSDGLEDDSEADAAENNADDSESEDEPVDLAYLADQLGVDKAEIYDVEVKLRDDQTVTLGQLKDNFIENGPVAEQKQELYRERDQYQRDVMTTKTHLNMMMAAAVTPQEQALLDRMMKAAAGNAEQWNMQQEQILRSTLPDWDDVGTKQREMADIVALASEYGFSQPEMEATKDARTLRLLRDAARDRARLAEMQAPAKREHARANPPAKRQRGLTKRKLKEAHARAKASPHLAGKTDFVRQLITDGDS